MSGLRKSALIGAIMQVAMAPVLTIHKAFSNALDYAFAASRIPQIGRGWDVGGRNGGRNRHPLARAKHTSRVKARKRTRCKAKRRYQR
jgi:hypothetical protein